jgi:hypothetical protein
MGSGFVDDFALLLPFARFSFLSLEDLSLFSLLPSIGLLRHSFGLEAALLVRIGEGMGVVGAGDSGGGVALLHEGLETFLAFFACLLRIFSSSSDEGQVPEFLREWPLSGDCAMYSRLAS